VSLLGAVLLLLGVLLLLVAAAGLFLLPDALARQHAATKSGTLALGLILVGALLHGGQPGWGWRVAAVLVLLVSTLPIASHMIARAAARHAYREDQLRDAPIVGSSETRNSRHGTGTDRRLQ
jgi:multicomponent Na+:H+ antiporter subunit G